MKEIYFCFRGGVSMDSAQAEIHNIQVLLQFTEGLTFKDVEFLPQLAAQFNNLYEKAAWLEDERKRDNEYVQAMYLSAVNFVLHRLAIMLREPFELRRNLCQK
jgi:hypothetical protein